MHYYEIPKQPVTNSHDCGVYSLIYGLHLAEERKMQFGEHDIDYYRRRILYDICQNSFGKYYNSL